MTKPLSVLLIDDNPARAEIVEAGLAAAGYRLLARLEGTQDLIGRVRELEPDVVVLDLQMPGPPPGELLTAMAATAPGVPIVTFSGFEPDLIAPVESRLVALHIPKTTDLALVRAAIVDVARGAGDA